MKKLLLTLLASLLVTGSAWAEWEKAAATDSADFYIDPATIRVDGNLRRIWEVIDYTKKVKDGHLSTRMRVEYDCKQERFRVMSISQHSGAMASGNNIYSYTWDPPRKWDDIPPNSYYEIVLKIVCAK